MSSILKPSKSPKKNAGPTKPMRKTKESGKAVKSPFKAVKPLSDDEDERDENEDENGTDEEGNDTDEGIDEEGMARLMKALGDDGLDEFDRVQLNLALGVGENALSGEEGEDEEEESDRDSQSEDEDESEGNLGKHEVEADDADENDVEQEQDVGVPLDDADFVDEDDVPQPKKKIEINNKLALDQIRETIQLDPSFPWTETLVLSYPDIIDVDVNDDLNRELAFYKQALHGANVARTLAAKHNFPFTRPSDYFAEMVKTDAHMERIRQRLLDETATIKRGEEKRKEREGKKYGKQVQVEKLKEREKSKKDMEDRLKGLKRRRKDVLDNPLADDDKFDIEVEDAIAERPAKRGRSAGPTGTSRGINRKARDAKYGFGGADRRSKQNTRESTDRFGSKSGRGGRGFRGGRGSGRGGGRGGGQRPGKGRRIAARSKS